MKKIALSVVAIVTMSSLAFAEGDSASVLEANESSFYGGLGMAYQRTYSIDSKWFDDQTPTQDDTGGVTGVIGYNYNEYVAVEGRISASISNEDYAEVLTYSLFVKPQYPVTEEFKIYALLGFGGVQVEGTDGDVPAHANMVGQEILDETSFQWGFGVSYAVTEDFSIFTDYTLLADDADISSTLYGYDDTIYNQLSNDAWTVGITFNF